MEFGVVIGSVDVQGDIGIIYRDVSDAVLMPVLDVARRGGRWGVKEGFDHFTPDEKRVTMFTGKFWNNGPDFVPRGFEGLPQMLDRRGACGRPVDQCNDGGIAAAIEQFAKAYLKGTELSAAGIGIGDDRCTIGIGDGSERGLVFASHDHDEVS